MIVAATSHERRAYVAVDPYDNVTFNGRQWNAVDSPTKGPGQVGSATGGPAAAGSSNKNFLARYPGAIAIGSLLLMGGGCAAFLTAGSDETHNSPQGSTTTTTSDEFDYEAKHFDPASAAFLRDRHGVWNFGFDPGDAVNEAHAMCALPAGNSASALPDIIRLIDPGFHDGDEDLGTVHQATKFMKVAVEHFCPGH